MKTPSRYFDEKTIDELVKDKDPNLTWEYVAKIGALFEQLDRSLICFRNGEPKEIIILFDKLFNLSTKNFTKNKKLKLEDPSKMSMRELEKILNYTFANKNIEIDYDTIVGDPRNLFLQSLLEMFSENRFRKIKLHKRILHDVNKRLVWLYSLVVASKIKIRLEKLIKYDVLYEVYENYFIEQSLILNSEAIRMFTTKKNRILLSNDFNTLIKPKVKIWNLLTTRESYQFKPNRKYDEKMYEFTSELKLKGKKDFVAYRETLEKFGFDPLKDDSYRKSYSKYLQQK